MIVLIVIAIVIVCRHRLSVVRNKAADVVVGQAAVGMGSSTSAIKWSALKSDPLFQEISGLRFAI